MKISNSDSRDLNNFIICPKKGCTIIPKIEYVNDLFYLLIECNNNKCNYKEVMDINNYIRISSKKLECLNYDHKFSNIDNLNSGKQGKAFLDNKCIEENQAHKENHLNLNFNNKNYY